MNYIIKIQNQILEHVYRQSPMGESLRHLFKIAVSLYFLVLAVLVIYGYSKFQGCSHLQQFNNATNPIVSSLVKTKYFRIIRLNLISECPLLLQNKLCKSKSCAVCRCDEKDIPQNWIITDKVRSTSRKKDVWEKQRETDSKGWIWHVEDEQNDKGEYFDINTNVESYSGYNGSYIWQLIYEENCFKGRSYHQKMCLEEQIFYKIISGLHASISSHLSILYKNITNVPEWADTGEVNFFFNQTEYQRRVLDHPDRVDNLLFLYELLLRAVQTIVPYLEHQHSIVSDNIAQDLIATNLMDEFITKIKNYNFPPLNSTFFQPNQPYVKQYQKYIHNISRILNCVECEKCKLFGKMQTYGLGTALKILLGYNTQYKRNELVALFNTLNKITVSVNNYYALRKTTDALIGAKIWGYCAGCMVLFLWVAVKWDKNKKVKKMFSRAFPKGIKFQ